MRNPLFIAIAVAASCSSENDSSNPKFSIKSIPNENWQTYEGKWPTKDGIVRLELTLSANSNNTDLYYKLNESFESEKIARGTSSQGNYTFHPVLTNNEFGICLLDLDFHYDEIYFRMIRPMRSSEEMFFVTRGMDELIPTDKNFKPLSLDKRYTLHRILNYFTVEGYITFNSDTVEYFEKNTMENWNVANLGEHDRLKSLYKKLTKEKYEGLYVRALAYSIPDTTSKNGKSLVIKRIVTAHNAH